MSELETLNEIPTADQMPDGEKTGFGGLETSRGHLPLEAMDVEGRLDGLYATTRLSQTFVNVFDEALEATYIFPLPDRAGVTEFRLEVGDRVVVGELQERGQARATYQAAIQAGHRAAIAEEERSGVFTMRAGNIPPGERVRVVLELAGPVVVADGEATYRFPLVVAPRYIPGTPLDGASVGTGTASDTDAVPDASRITPPVLLPGHPNPVHLTLRVVVDPAGLGTGALRSSLHQMQVEEGEGGTRIVSLRPGVERLNKDFVLRLPVSAEDVVSSLAVRPDAEGPEGSFALTVVPPTLETAGVKPRDVIVVLDRSGSMSGWKMVAARRASGRLLDTLTTHDRFAVLVFDDRVEEYRSATTKGALVPASDRERYRAVEYLSKIEDRGGTEMSMALQAALACFDEASAAREKVLVFVTDGQVGNEDQLLWQVRRQARGVRVHAVGIDRAVNAGFLRRLAEPTGGVFELVESEDRLDEAMQGMYRRIASPVVTGLRLEGWAGVDAASLSPDGVVDVFPGVPARLHGRYKGALPEKVRVVGTRADGGEFAAEVPVLERPEAPLGVAWARGRILDLEHRYVTAGERDPGMAADITALSLRFGVLCRFTAYVAVDREQVVNAGGEGHKVTQPVESPDGWEMMEKKEEAAECEALFDLASDLDGAPADMGEGAGEALMDLCLGAPPSAPEIARPAKPAPRPMRAPMPSSSSVPMPAPAQPPAENKPTLAGALPPGGATPAFADEELKQRMSQFASMADEDAPCLGAPPSAGGAGGLGLGDAVSTLAGKIGDLFGSRSASRGGSGGRAQRRREATTGVDSFHGGLRRQLDALRALALAELRDARDAEAVRQNLAYLAADLAELLEQAEASGLANHPLMVALRQVLTDLEALPEEARAPESEAFQAWLEGFARALEGPAQGEDAPPPRPEFWK